MSPRNYDMTKRRQTVDATRRRILEATMELHAEQGILTTSWEDIALRADVAPGTVYRHFPSLTQLVAACGELSMERLALPTAERLRELFAGATTPDRRIRLLVTECYAIYERASDVIVSVRREREREELPKVARAHETIETALDALVVEALEEEHRDTAWRSIVRAICDHDTWQALRRQGLDGSQTVDAAHVLLVAGREAWSRAD